MTGRIEVLAAPDKPGRITSNSGASRFHYNYRVPLGKMDGLAEGCLVSFELEKGSPETAISVCAREHSELPPGAPGVHPEVRYNGFEQTNNIRTYKFQVWQTGEENKDAIVTVDLALFRKHGITIQEGPALCSRLVRDELAQPSPNNSPVWKWIITDKEMLAHVASRAASTKKRN